ncbi:MAG: DNA polymerase III subunit beta [Chloroflexota bacterium]|nr:DNA polymerase III subunit beta [Chloroflexota bacterium]
MKVTLSQDLLARGLQIVGRAVAGGTSQPALTHVHLHVTAGQVQLTATDLRTVIRYTLPVQSHDGDGQFLLPARLFSEFVGAVPTSTLTLTTDPAHPDTVALSGGHTSATIRSGPLADFPAMPALVGTLLATLPVAALRDGIPHVSFAAAGDGKNPVLGAVLLEVAPDSLTLVATDGFRLAQRRLALPFAVAAADPPAATDPPTAADPPTAPLQLLVPPTALNDLAAILGGAPFSGPTPTVSTVTITRGANGNFVVFAAGALVLLTRLVDGAYPKYGAMLPTSHASRVVLPGHALRDAVRLAACFSADKHQVVMLHLVPAAATAPAGLTVDSESNERGANQSILDGVVDGADTTIALHAGYILQALGTFTGPVALELNGPQRPGILRPASGDGPTQLIMPMAAKAA